MKYLGLDIGSNSVGSAWADTEKRFVKMGVSVFPAGVEESENKRGAPKNQARRGYRSQRRSIGRRSVRKHQMRGLLREMMWMPLESEEEKRWLEGTNPWVLRREGLERELKPYEFGRVLLHLCQHRGAYGLDWDEEDDDEQGKIKDAIGHTQEEIKRCGARTFGEMMGMKFEERRRSIGQRSKRIGMPLRNRRNAAREDVYEFCADRQMLWQEFDTLWNKQKSFKGKLAGQLTEECRQKLDDPTSIGTWRYKGILFGQRKTYWNVGTMARCDLEPTDLRCPKADMYAQEFLVLETVNNIRITPRGELKRPLSQEEQVKVIAVLEKQKTASVATVRKALGIDKGQKKSDYTLSLESDEERGLNTNWFRREIVGAICEDKWETMSEKEKDAVNMAVLKFDPQEKKDVERLKKGCRDWWAFNEEQAETFIDAWKGRGVVDSRVNYSRRAIKNLLPYMRQRLTVNEARQRFAEDAENGASDAQRERYSFGARSGNKRVRQYIAKHPDLLPPAPEDLSNPVVRKAIHEVRRHIQAYMRDFGCKPERVVVELAREARQSAIVRNKRLVENRAREKERKNIIKEYKLEGETKTQQRKAVDRVLLCKEQKWRCAYCGDPKDTITEDIAVKGDGIEVDHIIPESRGGNSYLSNLVLCHTRCNRGKGNKTPIEWMSDEAFGRLEQRLKHLKDGNKAKWDNLHKEVPDLDGFVASQLTDTAYAAREVVGWLRDVLHDDEKDGRRRVFTTKGRYTAILRRDWGLFGEGKGEAEGEGEKNRSDHRHHAVDAVVIALSGPERLSSLAKTAEAQELARAEGYACPKRKAVDPPWGTVESFRKKVMEQYDNLIVCHRPARRRIAGELHKDEHFGAVPGDDEHFTKRIFAGELTPNHLRMPKGWEELRRELENIASKPEKRRIRSRMLAIKDVKPEKSGIVRDRWFREELRVYLRRNGFDPDSFGKDKDSKKKFKEFIKNKGLILKSGVPARRITLLRTLGDPIRILRKQFEFKTGEMVYDENPSSLRVYDSQNNHHIEIREDKNGKWFGEVINNFKAARRVRPPKFSGQEPKPAVNRDDTDEGQFVMSLSMGEMVKMKLVKEEKPGYFVVFKIDKPQRIHFTTHFDAGRNKETEKCPKRNDIDLSPAQLQKMEIEPGLPPQKVWVGPLGDVKVLERD
jgi:CRISPR-associated endonuclease Csn1